MSSIFRVFVVATFALCLCARTAAAAPIAIIETTDFSNTAPGATVGTLDVGTNTVSGGVAFLTGDLADYFQLDLPAGDILTGWTLTTAGSPGSVSYTPGGTLTSFTGSTYSSSLLFSPHEFLSPFSLTITGTNLASGPQTLTFGFVAPTATIEGGTLNSGLNFTYNLSFTVAAGASPTPVPEPASFCLLGTGVLALARRRKRA